MALGARDRMIKPLLRRCHFQRSGLMNNLVPMIPLIPSNLSQCRVVLQSSPHQGHEAESAPPFHPFSHSHQAHGLFHYPGSLFQSGFRHGPFRSRSVNHSRCTFGETSNQYPVSNHLRSVNKIVKPLMKTSRNLLASNINCNIFAVYFLWGIDAPSTWMSSVLPG